MEIFAAAVKILAQDVLLFGVVSVVGLLALVWLVFGSKPLRQWLGVSMPRYWSKLSPSLHAFAYAFFIVLVYSIGASFRAAADEWISDKPGKHLYLKDLWLLRDYPYLKKKHNEVVDRDKVEKLYREDAQNHTDKALKLYALAELVEHAEEASGKRINPELACRLKAYKAPKKDPIPEQENCSKSMNNKSYEAIEEVSRFYHLIKHLPLGADDSKPNKYDSDSVRANLVVDFMRLLAFLFFILAIAAALAIGRKLVVCVFQLKSKAWRPAIKPRWALVICIVSLIGYVSSAAAWQALEIDNNKIMFRKYFASTFAEKRVPEVNPVIADLNSDLSELGLTVNTTKQNNRK